MVGDSLAGGLPHLCFPSLLARLMPDWDISVSARGGDTLVAVGNRLAAILSRHRADTVVLEAGANDILLPYLEKRSFIWKMMVRSFLSQGKLPATDPSAFRVILKRILDSPECRAKNVALVTIPCLGEDLASTLNRVRESYNEVIRETALGRELRLADAARCFEEQLSRLGKPSTYLMEIFTCIFTDTFYALTPRAAFQLSGRRGLLLTLDGVHPNPLGARLLAETVAAALA